MAEEKKSTGTQVNATLQAEKDTVTVANAILAAAIEEFNIYFIALWSLFATISFGVDKLDGLMTDSGILWEETATNPDNINRELFSDLVKPFRLAISKAWKERVRHVEHKRRYKGGTNSIDFRKISTETWIKHHQSLLDNARLLKDRFKNPDVNARYICWNLLEYIEIEIDGNGELEEVSELWKRHFVFRIYQLILLADKCEWNAKSAYYLHKSKEAELAGLLTTLDTVASDIIRCAHSYKQLTVVDFGVPQLTAVFRAEKDERVERRQLQMPTALIKEIHGYLHSHVDPLSSDDADQITTNLLKE